MTNQPTVSPAKHRFTDEWLVPLLTNRPESLAEAIARARSEAHRSVSGALLRAGAITREQLAKVVEENYRIPSASPSKETIDRTALSLVPEKLCRNRLLLPLEATAGSIRVAMANPLDSEALQEVAFATGRAVKPEYCPAELLEPLLDDVLHPDHIVFDLLRKIKGEEVVEMVTVAEEDAIEQEQISSPVIQLVNAVIVKAVKQQASDIHLEHDECVSAIRIRVDGVLRTLMQLPRYLGTGPVVARIKIMSKLNIADRMRPQDGRAMLKVGEESVGLRVSTLPTHLGEKVVIRILRESKSPHTIDDLGLNRALLERIHPLIEKSQGMFLVTGPTGSGKTTTLHAVLTTLKSEDTNIVTIEDPVEYRLPGVNQVQVNEKQDLTFASVLRSVLRQDPDIIMVGEIRDAETAVVAFQAAQTGHLVFSTLHTNDTLSTIVRLGDMGLERFKIASALIAVTAQRLARRLCQQCRVEAQCDALLTTAMQQRGLPVRRFESKGCKQCGYSGYRGRVSLVELLEITDDLRDAVARGAAVPDMRQVALASKALHTMVDDALWHVAEGNTSFAEVVPYVSLEEEPKALSAGPKPEPASTQVMPGETRASTAEEDHLSLQGHRVLVAASTLAIRQNVEEALAETGVELESCSELESALAALVARPPEVVVVGSAMAGSRTKGLLHEVRHSLGMVSLPLLVLVAEAHLGRIRDFYLAGATDVIRHPVVADILQGRMRAFFRMHEGWVPANQVALARMPPDEAARLRALRSTGLLDSPPDEEFDSITRLAAQLLDVPIALVSLVDRDRQWFKSKQGLEAAETPREQAFCSHAILREDAMVVEDAALDSRFAENPLVLGEPWIRFYAGVPLTGSGGHRLGTLCVIDTKPRQLDHEQVRSLEDLGRLAQKAIDKRVAENPTS